MKECPFEAITLENNVAYIDYRKCRLCRKCVAVCPTGAIHELNFPPRKEATPAVDADKVKPVVPKATPAPKTAETTPKAEATTKAEPTAKAATAPETKTTEETIQK